MRPSKSHFVTSCQQLLALGAVLAVLTPAASVITLDVVRQHPATGAGRAAGHGHPVELTSYAGRSTAGATRTARVPSAPVDAHVEEYPLTASTSAAGRPRLAARTIQLGQGPRQVLSRPEPVVGFGGVGVTWDRTTTIPEDELGFEVRSRTGDDWSAWTPLAYDAEHGPDPDSAEARHARPGTDVFFVGDVDQVQVRATATGDEPPAGMRLAVVSPGQPTSTSRQAPALDGGATARAAQRASSASASGAPQPTIYSRKQWGANERLRDGFAGYGDISGGFVHHTVNSNDYSRSDVPGILRSIYAYHTQSRGWSDIGYNFLVDKFGRIWEGRYGGIDRPVIGAHTLGYNEDSFAMSAIGNYETARPSDAMLRAYGALFAWKLGRYDIDPSDTSVNIAGDTSLQAINGHRDAGSTACPGRYLYAQLPKIRDYAAAASNEPDLPEITEQQVDSDLAGTPFPDLVVRRRSDDRGLILPTGGLARFVRSAVLDPSGWGSRTFLTTPDLTGDDRVDLVSFDRRGRLEIRPGLASGGFGEVTRKVRRFRNHGLVASTGDLNRDGRPDFVARRRGHLVTFLGNRRGGFRRVAHDVGLRGYRQLVGAGDVTGDGVPDLWGRTRRGLVLNRGLGGGDFAPRSRVSGSWSGYDWIAGGVDYTDDSVPDLLARRGDGRLMLLPGHGDGTLGRPQGPVRNVGNMSMVSGAGQLTGNSAPDLVAARADGALVVLPNRGTFDLGRPIDTGQSFGRGNLLLNAGDFTGDGNGDVIMRRRIGSMWLFRGTGNGRLADPVWIAGKRPFRNVSDLRVVADVTGDDRNDLVGRLRNGQTVVWPGNGAERLGHRFPVEVVARSTPRSFSGYDWLVGVSDLRRRGRPDLVLRDRDGDLYRSNGRRKGYGSPRYIGNAAAYDLGG